MLKATKTAMDDPETVVSQIIKAIEAEKPEALKDVRKNLNLSRGVQSYNEIFKKVHKHGIGILASMIFGMENDSKKDLLARRDFIFNSSIDAYQCTILTPLPGTVLFDRMKAGNRIEFNNYPLDWQKYDGMMATVNNPFLDHKEMDETMHGIWMSLYNKETMRRKMFRTLWNTKSFRTAYYTYATSHNYGRMFLERFFNTDPNGVNDKFEWKNRKRSQYLKITDKVIWLFYQLSWGKITRHSEGRT